MDCIMVKTVTLDKTFVLVAQFLRGHWNTIKTTHKICKLIIYNISLYLITVEPK